MCFDTLRTFLFLAKIWISLSSNPTLILPLIIPIVAGTLQVSDYYANKNIFLKKINRLSKNIKVSSKKYYVWFIYYNK